MRFRLKRVSLAQTALRLHPRRRAICAALCPTAQSFLSSATSSVSQPMGDAYTPTANYRLACVAEPAIERITDSSRTSRHVPLVLPKPDIAAENVDVSPSSIFGV